MVHVAPGLVHHNGVSRWGLFLDEPSISKRELDILLGESSDRPAGGDEEGVRRQVEGLFAQWQFQ